MNIRWKNISWKNVPRTSALRVVEWTCVHDWSLSLLETGEATGEDMGATLSVREAKVMFEPEEIPPTQQEINSISDDFVEWMWSRMLDTTCDFIDEQLELRTLGEHVRKDQVHQRAKPKIVIENITVVNSYDRPEK